MGDVPSWLGGHLESPPPSPVGATVHDLESGKTYTWDGTAWVAPLETARELLARLGFQPLTEEQEDRNLAHNLDALEDR